MQHSQRKNGKEVLLNLFWKMIISLSWFPPSPCFSSSTNIWAIISYLMFEKHFVIWHLRSLKLYPFIALGIWFNTTYATYPPRQELPNSLIVLWFGHTQAHLSLQGCYPRHICPCISALMISAPSILCSTSISDESIICFITTISEGIIETRLSLCF